MTPDPVLEIYRHGRLVAIVVGWATALRLIPAGAGYVVIESGMTAFSRRDISMSSRLGSVWIW